MHLIGLMGRSRVGKDTVAGILMDVLKPTPFEKVHIAQPLKEALSCVYGFGHSQLFGNSKDQVDLRYNQTPRELCSGLSHFLMNTHGPDFLVRRTFERYDSARESRGVPPFWIIPDVRFQHDYDAIKRRGGVVWKITRMHVPIYITHESNIDGLPCDAVIHNDADIHTLREMIHSQVERERTKRTRT